MAGEPKHLAADIRHFGPRWPAGRDARPTDGGPLVLWGTPVGRASAPASWEVSHNPGQVLSRLRPAGSDLRAAAIGSDRSRSPATRTGRTGRAMHAFPERRGRAGWAGRPTGERQRAHVPGAPEPGRTGRERSGRPRGLGPAGSGSEPGAARKSEKIGRNPGLRQAEERRCWLSGRRPAGLFTGESRPNAGAIATRSPDDHGADGPSSILISRIPMLILGNTSASNHCIPRPRRVAFPNHSYRGVGRRRHPSRGDEFGRPGLARPRGDGRATGVLAKNRRGASIVP
jgi:hypothetical protein